MADAKEDARQKVAELVARYQALSPSERRSYNEEATKQHFIVPLFRELGWDPDSDELAPEEKASNGRVDYAFKLRDVPKFFLEAKPPRENLDAWAEKASSYALHRGVDWVVLTNFAELRLYYALGSASRVEQLVWKNLDCGQFEEYFDDLWLLSRESFASGLIDELARKDGRLPRRLTLEQSLFSQLQAWRERLINQLLHWHNASHPRPLLPEQADEIVQRLFNRLIFIRSCEDRKIEPRRLWEALQDAHGPARRKSAHQQPPAQAPLFPTARAERVAQGLRQVFAHYREHYDSELFGKSRYDLHLLDDPDIYLADELLEEVLQGLYQVPKRYAQYDFSLIDADIMGRVYEQYLGHVAGAVKERARQQKLRLQAGGQVEDQIQLEAKRQRRKAQGIYYTPKWVVDYIVQQTVGRALRELPYAQASQLSILDPACGSGSFLIRAYEELLRWYAQTTTAKAVEALAWSDRIGILAKHIYGVDLDPQAVEIAQLNLLLKALAGRNTLPVLAGNIRRGNSLISGSGADLRPYFGDAWEEKRPFDWHKEVPEIMARGGFDVIIGNPPYVETALIAANERDYFRANFESARGLFDLYTLFLERGTELLKAGGHLGFITSGKFLKAEAGKRLCELLVRETTIETVIDLAAQKAVFGKEATNYPVILVIRKGVGEQHFTAASLPPEPEIVTTMQLQEAISRVHLSVPQEVFRGGIWPPPRPNQQALFHKAESTGVPLASMAELYHGLQTNADPVFILETRRLLQNGLVHVHSPAKSRDYELESALLHPLLKGSVHMKRYFQEETRLVLLFPYSPSSTTLLAPEVMERDHPRTWAYLQENKDALESREDGRWREHPWWYGYTRRNNHDKFGTGSPRLLTPSIAATASFSYDPKGAYYFIGSGGGGGGGYGVERRAGIDVSLLFLLGLLNSKLLDYYLHQISSPFRGGYRAYNRQYIGKLPIYTIDPSNLTDRQMHDAIVAQVERMLALQERLKPLRGTGLSEAQDLEREIDRLDAEIDRLVYDLYGLTASERRLVEEGS